MTSACTAHPSTGASWQDNATQWSLLWRSGFTECISQRHHVSSRTGRQHTHALECTVDPEKRSQSEPTHVPRQSQPIAEAAVYIARNALTRNRTQICIEVIAKPSSSINPKTREIKCRNGPRSVTTSHSKTRFHPLHVTHTVGPKESEP